MAVFRVERTGNYTVMSNRHLRDKSLSLNAKGLLSLMLSLPETWDYTLSGLARINFPQGVVKSRLLKLDRQHIRFVFDCLWENTTQVRNMKQYLLTVLFNAPVTMESHYATQVNAQQPA